MLTRPSPDQPIAAYVYLICSLTVYGRPDYTGNVGTVWLAETDVSELRDDMLSILRSLGVLNHQANESG